jgi:hypothetical protein
LIILAIVQVKKIRYPPLLVKPEFRIDRDIISLNMTDTKSDLLEIVKVTETPANMPSPQNSAEKS